MEEAKQDVIAGLEAICITKHNLLPLGTRGKLPIERL
jgi:hypothetical protein